MTNIIIVSVIIVAVIVALILIGNLIDMILDVMGDLIGLMFKGIAGVMILTIIASIGYFIVQAM